MSGTKAPAPGRPKAGAAARHTPTALAILAAAEELFCTKGFAATSMRDVAAASRQPLSSASYYFGSKAGLFEAVFLRRIVPVNRRRVDMLKAYRSEGRVELADVVDAYLRPLFEQDGDGDGTENTTRLIMLFSRQLLSNPEEHDYLQGYYDEVAREFIGAIRRAVPAATAIDAAWGYNYMVGVLVFTVAGTAMTARVPGEPLRRVSAAPAAAPEETIIRLRTFLCAGLSAMGGASPPRADPGV